MLDKARPAAKPILNAISKPFLWIHPNYITFVGFLAGVIFFIFMSKEMYGFALISFFGTLIDSLDGTVARLTGKASKFGAFFDSTLDRITDAVMIMGFAAAGLISWPLATFTLLASLMISYTRAKAEQLSDNKIKLAVGIMERPERLIMLLIATVMAVFNVSKEFYGYNIYEWLFFVLLGLSIITILQRMVKAWKILQDPK